MTDTPLSLWRAMVSAGTLRHDPAQAVAVEKLQLLHSRLKGYEPATPRRVSRNWFGWGREPAHATQPLSGLYLYGGVGRGKSMLMDLFARTSPVRKTRRVHFHAFMQEIHRGIDAARAKGATDPIEPVAAAVAEDATVLCFDEMQITDIADAMIVGRLFEKLFARGVVVVTTSNRHPDDLYKDGLNRGVFLPFIAMLKERMDLHHLDGGADHRRAGAAEARRWIAPLGTAADAAMDAAWDRVAGGEGGPMTLRVQGREVVLPRVFEGVVRASFAELCEAPLGPADALAIAEAAEVLLLERIPILSPAKANPARRFVTLVDALYEAKRVLIASADAEPDMLYPEGTGAFEFERTASRLMEMRSAAWPPAQ